LVQAGPFKLQLPSNRTVVRLLGKRRVARRPEGIRVAAARGRRRQWSDIIPCMSRFWSPVPSYRPNWWVSCARYTQWRRRPLSFWQAWNNLGGPRFRRFL